MKWMHTKVLKFSFMVVAGAIMCLPAVWLPAQTTQQNTPQQEETFDLAKLSVWNDKTLPAEAKTVILADYLEGELKRPSKPKMGYGGIIDSEYIQRQIVVALRLAADPVVLADIIKRTQDQALKDRLLIALCMVTRGKNAVPEVIQILKTSKVGIVRALAAEALGESKQPEHKAAIIAALTPFLRDPYRRPLTDKPEGPWAYEVRGSAAAALVRLGVKVKRTDTPNGPIFEVVK